MSEHEVRLTGCLPVIIAFCLLAVIVKGCAYMDVMIARERAAIECANDN